jgi:hypothetical protein
MRDSHTLNERGKLRFSVEHGFEKGGQAVDPAGSLQPFGQLANGSILAVAEQTRDKQLGFAELAQREMGGRTVWRRLVFLSVRAVKPAEVGQMFLIHANSAELRAGVLASASHTSGLIYMLLFLHWPSLPALKQGWCRGKKSQPKAQERSGLEGYFVCLVRYGFQDSARYVQLLPGSNDGCATP